MGAFAPRVVIHSPPRPIPRPNGLGTVIEWVTNRDHMENGFTWKGYSCELPETIEIVCEDAASRPEKTNTGADDGPTLEADPFVVYSRFDCGVNGGYSYSEARDRAVAQLRAGEWQAIERTLMTNVPALSQSFQGAVDLTGADAQSIEAGIAALSSFLALNYGGVGIIHLPHTVAPFICGKMKSDDEGRLTVCGTGDRIAVGAGYEYNVGPDGTPPPPGEAWLYATGMIYGYRSNIIVNPDSEQSVDRAMNNRIVIAERVYALGWDCVTAAIRVKVGCCC